MIISSGFGNHLADAADKSIPEFGDDQTAVPSILLPGIEIMSPTNDLVGGLSLTANSSFNTFFEKLRAASSGATTDIIVTLSRGLWRINWNIAAAFQTTTFVAAAALVRFQYQFSNNTQDLAVMYRSTNCQNLASSFRCLVKDSANLRLAIGATGVSEAVNATVGIQAEKLI